MRPAEARQLQRLGETTAIRPAEARQHQGCVCSVLLHVPWPGYVTLDGKPAVSAVYPDVNPALTVLSIVVTPFAPFATSATNTLAMEAKYFVRAQQSEELKRHHRMHLLSGGLGIALFALDELRPSIPCNHAAWHLLSCYSMRKTLPLLQHCEAYP
jgi:hypothetical protein